MSSMSAANSEGHSGQEKQEEEEAKASDKDAAKASDDEVDEESSDDDEEMNISSKVKTKATMNETLQDFQLDGSNMGQNSPVAGRD